MTESEAINRLIDHFRIHDDGRPTPYLDDAVSIALKALEKQIPKKPISISSVENSMYVKCPTCKLRTVLYDGCSMDYCKNCGQAIDWSDTD